MEPRHEARPISRPLPCCWALCLTVLCVGCSKELSIGQCAPADSSGIADANEPGIRLPWSCGFETGGVCEFVRAGSFCYETGTASYALVTSPVREGTFAAAFTVSSDPNTPGTQARCARQGTFPISAYYGAWYYIPPVQIQSGSWNLFYFSSGDSYSAPEHGVWDVSLKQADAGTLELTVFDHLRRAYPTLNAASPIPIQTWFHLEVYYKRAADNTGEFAVYQDGQVVLDLTDIETDDGHWGQWYVGSYVDGLLSPATTTLYVDDVTISSTR